MFIGTECTLRKRGLLKIKYAWFTVSVLGSWVWISPVQNGKASRFLTMRLVSMRTRGFHRSTFFSGGLISRGRELIGNSKDISDISNMYTDIFVKPDQPFRVTLPRKSSRWPHPHGAKADDCFRPIHRLNAVFPKWWLLTPVPKTKNVYIPVLSLDKRAPGRRADNNGPLSQHVLSYNPTGGCVVVGIVNGADRLVMKSRVNLMRSTVVL